MRQIDCTLTLLTLTACAPGWEPPTRHGLPSVIVEPVGGLEAAPAVLRLRVTGALRRSNFADFRLFEGTLSPYHLGRLRRRDVPATLLEREVTSVVWGQGADVLVAPATVLREGTYSLASAELGLLAEVAVQEALVPWLERAWPPKGQPLGRGTMVFCGAGQAPMGQEAVTLEPGGLPANVRRGLGGDAPFERDCVRVEPSERVEDGTLLLPPPLVAGVALEPLPLVVGMPDFSDAACEPGELSLGPGCVLVEDDRVHLRSPGSPSFWALREPEQRFFLLRSGQGVVVRGLEPDRDVRLAASVLTLDGKSVELELDFRTSRAIPHLVINEVLANPVGAERSSEWVELVNDGRGPVALGGYELRDTTGSARLPDVVLDPGELALVVGEAFAPDPELDVVAPGGVQHLVVPALGSGGLANSGEPLRLLDPDGRVVSRFPSAPGPKAGYSFARVAPDAADAELTSFGPHAPPGASPGAPNVVAVEP